MKYVVMYGPFELTYIIYYFTGKLTQEKKEYSVLIINVSCNGAK